LRCKKENRQKIKYTLGHGAQGEKTKKPIIFSRNKTPDMVIMYNYATICINLIKNMHNFLDSAIMDHD